jgi:hypothetical protein
MEKLTLKPQQREEKWTETLTLGSQTFIEYFQKTIGAKHRNKTYDNRKGSSILK